METSRLFQARRHPAHAGQLCYGGLDQQVEMPVFSLLSMQEGQEADLSDMPDTLANVFNSGK